MNGGGVAPRGIDATPFGIGVAVLMALLATGAAGAEGGGEIRVRSGPGTASTVVIGVGSGVRVEDRTPAAVAGSGETASRGETFAGDVTFFLRGQRLTRPATIDVTDPVVSAVRLFPDAGGATVTVFVRQPVTYTIAAPSAGGEVRVTVSGKGRPLAVTSTARGRPQTKRPQAPAGADEVALDAESLAYDQQTNTLKARGGVTLTRGDTSLTADEVLYDRTNAVAQARGHVVIVDPQGTVSGSFAHLNLDDESGWVETADATLEPTGYSLVAGRLEKRGGPRYSVADGVFTTCECGGLERPSWSLATRQCDVQLQGTGVARGATFRIKDMPVLYFPYFAFPAATERQTGLLLPRLGYSNRRGFQYEQPFYWAIDKSSDATVGIDLETAARVGGVGEYRYVVSQRTRGEFAAAYYNEHIGGIDHGMAADGTPTDAPENRFMLSGRHVQPFLADSKLFVDLLAVSDDEFFRDINTFAFIGGNEVTLRSTRFTASRAEVLKTWRGGLASVSNTYSQDLIDPQEFAIERLPNLRVEHGVPLLHDAVVARIGAEATDFWREQGFDGVRGDVAPEVFVPFQLGNALSGSVTGQLRETAYRLFKRDQVALVRPTAFTAFDFGTGTCAGGARDGQSCSRQQDCCAAGGGDCGTCQGLTSAKRLRRLGPDVENFQTYTDTYSGPFRDKNLPRLDAERTRELGTVNGRVGTTVQRVFDFPYLGLERVLHTIEPEVQYLFVPGTHRPDATEQLPSCADLQTHALAANPNLTVAQLQRQVRAGINCDAQIFSEGFLFDERDAIERRNFISYGLTTRVLARAPGVEEHPADEVPAAPPPADAGAAGVKPAKPAPARTPPRELLRASVMHGYDISRTLVGDSHASDVDFGIRVAPTDYLSMTYNTTVSLQSQPLVSCDDPNQPNKRCRASNVRGQGVGVVLREPGWAAPARGHGLQSPSALGISYRFVDKDVNEAIGLKPPESLVFRSQGVNEIDGGVYLRLGNYLGFTFLSRYTLDSTTTIGDDGKPTTLAPHFLERDYLLRLISRCNCWALDVGLADKFNPDERSFRIQFTLVGLGSVGRTPSQINYVGIGPTAPSGRYGTGFAGGGFY